MVFTKRRSCEVSSIFYEDDFFIATCLNVLTKLKTKKYTRWELKKWSLIGRINGVFLQENFAGPKILIRYNGIFVISALYCIFKF